MDRAEFIAAYGGLYEHSPWIAASVYDAGLEARHDTREGLFRALSTTMLGAPRAQRLALIRAHPELACSAATALTRDSKSEQSSAGLDRCSPTELQGFASLNREYREKFAFPFIIAVRGLDRPAILRAFTERLANPPEAEFRIALEQINRIAWNRLEAL